jgi:tetratricopeptide (TPR) repeat protein
MRAWLVVVALLAACRGEPSAHTPSRDDAAVSSAVVPVLPRSDDGEAAMRGLDADIARYEAAGDYRAIALMLDRAAIRGQLEDYTSALAAARAYQRRNPTSADAVAMVARAQLAVHDFAGARASIAELAGRVEPRVIRDLQVSLDQATGNLEAALVARKARVDAFPDAQSVTLYAATLAEAGRTDEAIALIPTAVQHLRNNTPLYFAWLLFQWGRLYEQAGQLATARDFFAEAHRRLPAHVEVLAHLAAARMATGDRAGAAALVALGAERHPSLLAIAATVADESERPRRVAVAAAAWERYVTALPAAFADHAARFYLDVGANPSRALELARINLAARDTLAARGLVVEAALAAGDPARACAELGGLPSGGPRRDRFQAWRALVACGRTAEAEQLARALGITTPK